MTVDISKIRDLAIQLEQALRFEPTAAQLGELAGDIEGLSVTARSFLGRPYEYGVPGSDPNVEQLGSGLLHITLLQPLMSGAEKIEALVMRPPTVGDILAAGEVQAKTSDSNKAQLAKMASVLTTEAGRKLVASELHGLLEEESDMLVGALSFLAGRFRRTRRVFKTA